MAHEALNRPAEIPPELNRWNWGAFFLNWIWGIGNSTYIALLALIPGINLIMMIVLGWKGSRWAWKNRYWKDAEHFRATQRKWALWGAIVWAVVIAAGAGLVFSIPYVMKSSEAYRISMEMVRGDERVREALGEEIEAGFWTGGNISVQAGGTGTARLAIPVSGDNGSGTVTSYAVRAEGRWDIRLLLVTVEGSGAPIVLVNKDNLRIPNNELDI